MAEKVDYLEDTWYHQKEVTGRIFLVVGLILTITGIGSVIGIPLALFGLYRINNSPGPVKNVEVEE